MNKTTDKTKLTATRDNTVFVSIAAWSDYESKTATFRQSAADHEIPFVFCDIGEPWQGFYHHKIKRMSEQLQRFREEGKHFAFVLDCRDIVFIEHVGLILEKFNALHDGRVIFNHDAPGKVWPSHKEYLASAMEEAMGSEHARLNAGALAGNIETILKIQHHTTELRRELEEGCPRSGILETIYRDIGTSHINDDQHMYQICLTHYPELFQIDYDKELFAVLLSYPKDITEHSDDPSRHDVINNAAILHSPWLSHGQEWNDRTVQHRWKR